MERVDENIFSKGTEEEQKKRELLRKRFTTVSGVLLLLVAAVLFLSKSAYVKNKIALLSDAEQYFVFVEKKSAQGRNEILLDRLDYERKQIQAAGGLHVTKSLTATASAETLLKELLQLSGAAAGEAQAQAVLVRTDGAFGIKGELSYAGETYPFGLLYRDAVCTVQNPVTGETEQTVSEWKPLFSVEKLLTAKNGERKQLKKLLEKYESHLFTELSYAGVTMEKKVVRSVASHVAYQNRLQLAVTGEQLAQTVCVLTAEAEEDAVLRQLYETAKTGTTSYEEVLSGLRQLPWEMVSELSVTLYVDNYGTVTGRQIRLGMDGQTIEFGYGYVRNSASAGWELYVRRNEEELLSCLGHGELDGLCVTGEVTATFPVEGEPQELVVSLKDFGILDLVSGKLTGDIRIVSELFRGISFQLSVQSDPTMQQVELDAVYGGVSQWNLRVVAEDAEPQELPEFP